MNIILTKFLLAALLLSTNTSVVQAAAAANDESIVGQGLSTQPFSLPTVSSASLATPNTSVVQASAAADDEGVRIQKIKDTVDELIRLKKLPEALDMIVDNYSLHQYLKFEQVISQYGPEVYRAAMNGDDVGSFQFDKQQGEIYLKKHASVIKNGEAQKRLNELAYYSNDDVTGIRYLEDRFLNHKDEDAGIRLNFAAAKGTLGFIQFGTGLEYLEQQSKRYMQPGDLSKLTGEALEKQLVINRVAEHARHYYEALSPMFVKDEEALRDCVEYLKLH